jgi:hypothetical protein
MQELAVFSGYRLDYLELFLSYGSVASVVLNIFEYSMPYEE